MINTVEVAEMQVIYKELTLKEFILTKAKFLIFSKIPKSWESYKLPPNCCAIYLYYNLIGTDGYESEHEIGFLVLEQDELDLLKSNQDLYDTQHIQSFCLSNLNRIIHADPADR